MTTDHELLAMIDVIENSHRTDWEVTGDIREMCRCHIFASECQVFPALKALRAVVAKEEKDIHISERGKAYDMGYNQALADVKADIEKALLEKAGE